GTDALVRTVSETQVPARVSGDVESLRAVDEFAVPVPGRQVHQQPVPGANLLAAEGEVFGRHSVNLGVHDGEITHELFDGIGDDGGIVGLAESLEHFAMLEQRYCSQRNH